MYIGHWSDFVTSDEICSHTEQPVLSNTICTQDLSSFLVISAMPTPSRIITGLSRLAFWALLESRD